MKVITVHIRATALTMAPVHIIDEAQSWLQLAIDHTIAAPDIGMAACTMSGSLATGRGGMANECGSVAITLREDTKLLPLCSAVASAHYKAVTSPPSKPRKVPTSVSERSWRFR